MAHNLCGVFGVALGAVGMLGSTTIGFTIDAYGPIPDNAGGVAGMSCMPETVRALTDCLGATGNTMADVGNVFAIASAPLVSLSLFGAFTARTPVTSADRLNPWVFAGLLLGAIMPYALAAWAMRSVGVAAVDMMKERWRQFRRTWARRR